MYSSTFYYRCLLHALRFEKYTTPDLVNSTHALICFSVQYMYWYMKYQLKPVLCKSSVSCLK